MKGKDNTNLQYPNIYKADNGEVYRVGGESSVISVCVVECESFFIGTQTVCAWLNKLMLSPP